MKILSFFKKNMRLIVYSFFIISPPILTSTIYTAADSKLTTSSKLSGLSSLSHTLYALLDSTQQSMSYTLSLLTTSSSFQTLSPIGIASELNHFLYFNESISNAYALDMDKHLIYGINDTLQNNINYTAHIDSALTGVSDYYSTFIGSTPFTQLAVPIHSPSDASEQVGVLIVTLNFDYLQHTLQGISTSDNSIKAYLFDSEGRILSKSFEDSSSSQGLSFDIDRIKQGLSFDPLTTFIDLDGSEVNGLFFTLPSSNWTLLITTPVYTGIENTDLVSILLGFLGVGGVSTSEFIRKAKANKVVIDDLSEQLSDSIDIITTSTDSSPDCK